METFDKNTPIGKAFDNNSQVGVFDKNTSIGGPLGVVADNVTGANTGNLSSSGETESTENPGAESDGN